MDNIEEKVKLNESILRDASRLLSDDELEKVSGGVDFVQNDAQQGSLPGGEFNLVNPLI